MLGATNPLIGEETTLLLAGVGLRTVPYALVGAKVFAPKAGVEVCPPALPARFEPGVGLITGFELTNPDCPIENVFEMLILVKLYGYLAV